MTAFDEATAITPVGEGCYHVHPDKRFAIVAREGTPGPVHGGMMMAAVLRAVLDSSPFPYPVATSAHFMRAVRTEPAHVRVSWLKEGKTAAVARATVVQQGVCVIEATVTTGKLGEPGSGQITWMGEPPVLPPLHACLAVAGQEVTGGYPDQVDLRLDPATATWLQGSPAGKPEMRGYFRLREGRAPDAYLLAVAVDALPPVVFGLAPVGWSPTVELTWYMRAVPAPGMLRITTRCRHVSGGWFDEEAEVWDSESRLVAQSRQLARVGRNVAAGNGA